MIQLSLIYIFHESSPGRLIKIYSKLIYREKKSEWSYGDWLVLRTAWRFASRKMLDKRELFARKLRAFLSRDATIAA